jgi:uncharacterized membrane protein YdjX (TVP38/TMEM64 family)
MAAPTTHRTSASHRSRKTPPHRWALRLIIPLCIIVGAIVAITHFGWAELHERLAALPPVLVLACMAILPVFGFSIAAMYLLAGAKFGIVWGGVAIAGTTAFHLLASHWIGSSFLRKRAERLLTKYRGRFPEVPRGENVSFATIAALVPGPPYFIRNYILAVSHVPLKTYFWICLPIYVIRSYVTLALGDMSSDFSAQKLLTLGAILAVKLGICAYLLHRMRKRIRRAKHA